MLQLRAAYVRTSAYETWMVLIPHKNAVLWGLTTAELSVFLGGRLFCLQGSLSLHAEHLRAQYEKEPLRLVQAMTPETRLADFLRLPPFTSNSAGSVLQFQPHTGASSAAATPRPTRPASNNPAKFAYSAVVNFSRVQAV